MNKKELSLNVLRDMMKSMDKFEDMDEMGEKPEEKGEKEPKLVKIDIIKTKPMVNKKKLSAEDVAKLLSGEAEESPMCEECGSMNEDCKCEEE